jgi:flagellar biosynthesis/type III secretory pathway protein FliH
VPAADGTFVSFAQLLRPEPACDEIVPVRDDESPDGAPLAAVALPAESAELARDVRLFRARLADAFEAACEELVREFAYAVLGRELLLAPPDLAAIAARVLAEHPAALPLRMRVAPSDAAALAAHADRLPLLVHDCELVPGDVMFEFAAGEVDARFGVRLAAVLGDAT